MLLLPNSTIFHWGSHQSPVQAPPTETEVVEQLCLLIALLPEELPLKMALSIITDDCTFPPIQCAFNLNGFFYLFLHFVGCTDLTAQ